MRVPSYGRADLAVKGEGKSYELLVEIKILGASYQQKVLAGGSFQSLAKILHAEGWLLSEEEIDKGHSFSLVHDYRRLRDISSAHTKILLLVVISEPGRETELGEALAKIEFPTQSYKLVTSSEVESISARLWQLERKPQGRD